MTDKLIVKNEKIKGDTPTPQANPCDNFFVLKKDHDLWQGHHYLSWHNVCLFLSLFFFYLWCFLLDEMSSGGSRGLNFLALLFPHPWFVHATRRTRGLATSLLRKIALVRGCVILVISGKFGRLHSSDGWKAMSLLKIRKSSNQKVWNVRSGKHCLCVFFVTTVMASDPEQLTCAWQI